MRYFPNFGAFPQEMLCYLCIQVNYQWGTACFENLLVYLYFSKQIQIHFYSNALSI